METTFIWYVLNFVVKANRLINVQIQVPSVSVLFISLFQGFIFAIKKAQIFTLLSTFYLAAVGTNKVQGTFYIELLQLIVEQVTTYSETLNNL